MEKSGQAGILPMDRVLNTPKPVRKWRPPSQDEAVNPTRSAPKPAAPPVVRKPKSRPTGAFPHLAPKPSVNVAAPAHSLSTQASAENDQKFGATPPLSSLHNFGQICASGFLLSAFSNDILNHVGGKAYLSWVFGPLAILALVICGTLARGVKPFIGKLWLGFAACLLFSTAFSMVKGESFQMIEYYFTRTIVIYFWCTAFALTIRNVHKLMMVNVICTALMILEAILFGLLVAAGWLFFFGCFFLGFSFV